MTEPIPVETGLIDEQAFTDSLIDLDPMRGQSSGTGSEAALVPAQPSEKDRVLDAEVLPGRPTEVEGRSWVGKRLGRFKLLSPLGEGGMGMVVQALDTNLDRIVALKIMRKRIHGVDEQQRVQQFLREARAAAKIEHPNAAQIYEINEHKGWWYIATELIEGGTLDQVVKAAGKLPPAAVCPLIADAASVLAVAHRQGIIHRDIKPHNLMLTRNGRCKVVDFGLVRLEDPNDPFDFTSRAVGTPHYLPPEAIRRAVPTPAYDIYSLGAALYYALAGKPPFIGQAVSEVLKQHLDAPRPDVREENAECSERLSGLIQRMMAVDPKDRPSASEVAATLRLENIGANIDPAALILDHNAVAGPVNPSIPTGFSRDLSSSIPGSHVLGTGGSTVILQGVTSRVWIWITRIAAVSVVLVLLFVVGRWALSLYQRLQSPPVAKPRVAFEHRFADTVTSYGVLDAGEVAVAPSQIDAPPFSWALQLDPGDNRYVASRQGQMAYLIGRPVSVLIPADQAIFFEDADAAIRAGKQPAK